MKKATNKLTRRQCYAFTRMDFERMRACINVPRFEAVLTGDKIEIIFPVNERYQGNQADTASVMALLEYLRNEGFVGPEVVTVWFGEHSFCQNSIWMARGTASVKQVSAEPDIKRLVEGDAYEFELPKKARKFRS